MHPKNFLAPFYIGQVNRDLAVKSARAQQRRIQHIGTIGGGDNNDAFLSIEPVHLDEKRIQGLLALVMAATNTMTAMAPDRVDLVDEYDAGRRFLSLFKHVAHTRGAHANEHLHKIRSADGEEWHICFSRDRAREQGFTSARRTDEQNAFWNSPAQFLKFFWVAQKLDEFLDFVLSFLDARDVFEGDLVFV